MPSIQDILDLGRVMPVIVIDDSSKAVGLANALLEGGIRTIEITLRTNAALDAIRAVANECPISPLVLAQSLHQHWRRPRQRRSSFAVSPGTTESVIKGCEDGSATATWSSHRFRNPVFAGSGFNAVKFFPASAAGGPNFIKSLISRCRLSGYAQLVALRSPALLTGWRWLMCPALAAAGLHHKPPFLREILTQSQVTPELLQHSRATTVLTGRVIPRKTSPRVKAANRSPSRQMS